MKMSKIFAGMSALAMAAAIAAPVTADEAPVENQFYNATGSWTITYNGADMLNENICKETDPASDWVAPEDAKGQLIGYTNADTGEVKYNFGCNIQVGHMKKAKVTVKVTSSTGNIWDGANAVSEGYMYTVQSSWNGDAPSDFNDGWKKYDVDENGNQVMAKGACDLVDWNSGSGKFNGNWAQVTLTDDDLSALTFEVTITADDKTTWEYHPYTEETAEDYKYILFNFGGAGCFTPSSVSGEGDAKADVGTSEDGTPTNTVSVGGDYINAQFGGETSPEYNNENGGGEDKPEGDGSSNANSDGSKSDSNSSGSSSKGSTSSNKSGGGSTGGGSKTSTTSKSTSTSSTGDGTSASDATENADSGAAAGVGLAFAAIAGAAMVVSRKK